MVGERFFLDVLGSKHGGKILMLIVAVILFVAVVEYEGRK